MHYFWKTCSIKFHDTVFQWLKMHYFLALVLGAINNVLAPAEDCKGVVCFKHSAGDELGTHLFPQQLLVWTGSQVRILCGFKETTHSNVGMPALLSKPSMWHWKLQITEAWAITWLWIFVFSALVTWSNSARSSIIAGINDCIYLYSIFNLQL